MVNKGFKRQIKIRFLLVLVLILIYLIIPSSNAQTTFNVCCEKTENGAWCQNTLKENCDTDFRVSPTNCKSTSFCKPGCCVDSDEGLCMENTPQRVCEEETGSWIDDQECNIAQCNLGCCILGDQASFVTLTRCKKLSGFYGLETNFNSNINDEATCILTAYYQDKGACVFESENQRTCKFTTRKQCLNIKPQSNITSEPEFFKDYLCSADELATNCGPTTETICIDGKDEVYFKDSCGNPGNIYDSARIYSKDPSYWQKVVLKSQTCGYNSNNGNAGSKDCGNCDYFKGSICSKGIASYGSNICTDLNCEKTENGNAYKNGESWCVYQNTVGIGRDLVGSRHFRHLCINGEELIEPCADARGSVCIENKIETDTGEFREAACRINRWSDCIDQTDQEHCLNTDKRDCYWMAGFTFYGALTSSSSSESSGTITSTGTFTGGTTGGFGGGITGSVITGNAVANEESGIKVGGKGVCLPEIPPGLKFWNQGDASAVCSLGNAQETVTYSKGILTGLKDKCDKNCDKLQLSWVAQMNDVCTSLGDCGAYANIAGEITYGGAEWKIKGEKQVITGLLNDIKNKAKV